MAHKSRDVANHVKLGQTAGDSTVTGSLNRITITPGVCGGRPCIRGLRVRVTDILGMLAGEATREEILADLPLSRRR
jgi:uncharacterized protein (DUF433 family)